MSNPLLKMYVGDLKGGSNLPVLIPNLDIRIKDSWLFMKRAFDNYREPVFDLTKNPETADFLLIPYNYSSIQMEEDYIDEFVKLSRLHHKKILIFAYGDNAEEIQIPNAIIFRPSQYGCQKKDNEIIMPGYTEDLGLVSQIKIREKGNKPIIGFCGWADFKDFKSRVKYYLKVFFGPKGVKRQGIYFRRRALGLLLKSGKIKTNFIIRKSYSGHSKTIEVSEEMARRQYVENIMHSDFVLAVKGDGNFSYRFFEALSMGRLPLFVDTDCLLPLDGIINYRDFVLFVNYENLDTIAEIVADYWTSLSDTDYKRKQILAREAFEKYLRSDKYFEYMFRERKIYDYIK